MKKYRVIYEGATVRAIAAAVKSPDDTLILETDSHVGADHIECMRPGVCANAPETELSKKLYKKLDELGYIRHGLFHPHALEAELLKELSHAGANLLFHATVLSHENGTVKAICENRMCEFECERFIPYVPEEECTYNVLVSSKDSFLPYCEGGFETAKTVFENLMILKCPAKQGEPHMEIRNRLRAFFENRPAGFEGVEIAHLPSCVCGKKTENLFEALDAGWKEA